MEDPTFQPLSTYQEYPADEMERRAKHFYQNIGRRRTVRDFSDRPVEKSIIDQCLLAAGTAPSGANMQPWHFAVVSDQKIKAKIRMAAEEEESQFYREKAPKEWLDALAPLGTDAQKPFLEIAPWLIAIFVQRNGVLQDGRSIKHYYATESVGIATGMLITAVHNAGLVSLTHTPSPMKFLNRLLGRPVNERPFLLLVVGYPGEAAKIPIITKKTLEDIATYV